ncbi:hypothetical protein POM88_023811 [Heracleum sosnowskyi]|uniref:Helitron helicase-like domain-containing protein n=1 Tax=Heracleum sosnowskyi TaxID=360622 RepID=A0AAD8IIB7_9APIA|nr:hypothetical protein POM88_023811 [Heracleum sosnowskyi]
MIESRNVEVLLSQKLLPHLVQSQKPDSLLLVEQLRRRLNKRKQTFAANNSILDIGDPDQHCGCCAAHVWRAEYTGRPSGPGPKGYSICCGKGKVQLPLLQETPVELATLLGGTTSRAKKFQRNIRVYNIIFALCSFGGSVDESINNGSGPFVFRVNDLTYHSVGSLLPPDGHTPKFAQFYMYDGQEAIEHRVNFPRDSSVLDPAIVATLQEMLSRDCWKMWVQVPH